jgi:hypothetical protein
MNQTHRPRTRNLLRIALLACAAALVMPTGAFADAPPPARELSQFETYWGASLERDCGFSQTIGGGKALWLFCDTQVYNARGERGEFIAGATAAEGSYKSGEVPTTLTEIPKPPTSISGYPFNGGPQQFLPPPEDVHAPGGGSCPSAGGYAASWTSGLTAIPGSEKLLIVYDEVCVTPKKLIVEGLAMREYTPSTNTLSGPSEIFKPSSSGAALPQAKQLGSPIFSEGFFYMFAGNCPLKANGEEGHGAFGECVTAGGVDIMGTLGARSYYTNPSDYEWETASGWSKSAGSAVSIISGARPENPASVTVNSYPGKGLAMITEKNIGGAYQVYLAPSGNPSAGHWSTGHSAEGLAGCSHGRGEFDFCRALIGHPEISTSSDMLMSYFEPEIHHVEVIAVPW